MGTKRAGTIYLALVAVVLLVGSAGAATYEDAVLADAPLAYWRLGEAAGAATAQNRGILGASQNGLYSGSVTLGQGGLLAGDGDSAASFDAVDGEVRIPSNPLINTGGPYRARTVELWFEAGAINVVPTVLFEAGGGTRGLNMFVQSVDATPRLFMSIWNRGEAHWGPITVSTPITEGIVYHAVLVFEASRNGVVGDFDGRLTGYLNGNEFATVRGTDLLYGHTGRVAIGGIDNDTLFPDMTQLADGANFLGVIDDVAFYGSLLDDPDGNGDRSDSRVDDHFAAGAQPACPFGLQITQEESGLTFTWQPGQSAAQSVRVTRNGTVIAAAAPVTPPRFNDPNPIPGDLTYEFLFSVAGTTCETINVERNGCISALTARTTACDVTLNWANGLIYSGIEVRRNGQLLANLAGNAESHTDTDPLPGIATYTVAPTTGSCAVATIAAGVSSPYADVVRAHNPFGYWTMGDAAGSTNAPNAGSAGGAIDGTYSGAVQLEQASLVPSHTDTAASFDGFLDSELQIPDSALINTGGPHVARTIEFWFQADSVEPTPQVLFEEGGNTRGLSITVVEVNGDDMLYLCGWNQAEEQWGNPPICAAIEIEEGLSYHVAFVFEATTNAVFGDFDGRITGYLNGEEFDEQTGVDRLYGHASDIAFGGASNQVRLHDNTTLDEGANFVGTMDEAAIYDYPLDDPNGDGDRSDSRVLAHYLAAAGSDCPLSAHAERNGSSVRLSWCPGTGPVQSVRVTRNGTVLAAAAPGDPREYVDQNPPPGLLEYELTFNVTGATCDPVPAVYDACIQNLTTTGTPEGSIVLTWTNGMPYPGGIRIARDLGGGETVLEANHDGSAELYVDTTAPDSGVVTYLVSPAAGTCTPASAIVDLDCFLDAPTCAPVADGAVLEVAFAFGTHPGTTLDLQEEWCISPNEPGTPYMAIAHTSPEAITYSEDVGWGFEVLYPDPLNQPFGARNGYGIFGPIDDTANDRNDFPTTNCPEELYNSFIGCKDWGAQCDETVTGDPDEPCTVADDEFEPEGIIFRVDVPNGEYRFVGAFGDSDNPHCQRILAEDGGAGLPEDIGTRFVTLVNNFDQARYGKGQVEAELGDGMYARVGFNGRIPPEGDGIAPDPQFINMDEEGLVTGECPTSPTLQVTQGYIRFHCLQANSNSGCGGTRDPNGSDLVILELWRVSGGGESLFIRGDANADGGVNIADAIALLGHLFSSEPAPTCPDTADANDDGTLNIADAIAILGFLFGGQGNLPAPAGACGPDPTADQLGTCNYPQNEC